MFERNAWLNMTKKHMAELDCVSPVSVFFTDFSWHRDDGKRQVYGALGDCPPSSFHLPISQLYGTLIFVGTFPYRHNELQG